MIVLLGIFGCGGGGGGALIEDNLDNRIRTLAGFVCSGLVVFS